MHVRHRHQNDGLKKLFETNDGMEIFSFMCFQLATLLEAIRFSWRISKIIASILRF